MEQANTAYCCADQCRCLTRGSKLEPHERPGNRHVSSASVAKLHASSTIEGFLLHVGSYRDCTKSSQQSCKLFHEKTAKALFAERRNPLERGKHSYEAIATGCVIVVAR